MANEINDVVTLDRERIEFMRHLVPPARPELLGRMLGSWPTLIEIVDRILEREQETE